MPIYEYECEACGNRFELIQRLSDEPIVICPKCGEPKVHKLMSSPAIQFKGSGFYINDYAKKGSGEPSKSGGGAESKNDDKSGSDKKSEKTAPAASASGSTSTSSTTPSPASPSSSSGSSDKSKSN
jgi:putative FmdB family regulatory protein